MKKKTSSIILIVVAILVVGGCFFATGDVKKDGKGLTSSVSEADQIIANAQAESSAVKEDEMREYATTDVDGYLYFLKATDKKRLVLVASPTCGYCQIASPIIHNIAFRHNIKIYYLDTSKFDSDAQSKFVNSDERFAEGFGTPMLLLVSEGKIHDSVDGLTDTAGYEDFFKTHGYISE